MAAWTEERKAKEAARRASAKEGIVTPGQEEESVVTEPTETPLLDMKPDLSRLNDDDKMQSLTNLLRVLPKQYRLDPASTKENIWRIARFEPTDDQLVRAYAAIEAIENEPKRNQR